jgi:hypothetical protein
MCYRLLGRNLEALFRLSLRAEFTSFAFRVTCHCQFVHEKSHGCGLENDWNTSVLTSFRYLSFGWLCSCIEKTSEYRSALTNTLVRWIAPRTQKHFVGGAKCLPRTKPEGVKPTPHSPVLRGGN